VQVRLPTEFATVWFGGSKTNQSGAVREFVSPALEPGGDYVYEIRARWRESGGIVDQTRQVTVRAGQRVVVNFGAPQ